MSQLPKPTDIFLDFCYENVYTFFMKTKLSLLFTFMTLLVMAMTMFEVQTFSAVQSEMAVESVSELENSENESIADTAKLVNNSMVLEMSAQNHAFSDKGFVVFTLSKDIFRPPRLA